LLIGSGVLGLGGRLMGLAELLALAAAGVSLVAGAVAFVHLRRVAVDARRLFHPGHVVAGGTVQVEIVVRNRSRRRAPLLIVHDRCPGLCESPSFALAPLASAHQAHARYRLSVAERGTHLVGPLVLRRSDPFGVASWSSAALSPSTLVAFPHVDDVAPPPGTVADAPLGGPLHRGESGRHEDFATLRAYVEGDDLRLVHWASTAKYDVLVVREDEAPRSRCTTVLLDLRHDVHQPASLEAAVSAAASVAAACWRQGAPVRVVTTGGLHTTAADGEGDIEAVLAHLAAVGAGPGRSLADVAASTGSVVHQGGVVTITTHAAPTADVTALARFLEGSVSPILVRFERLRSPGSSRYPTTPAPAPEAFDLAVDVTAERPFPVAWQEAIFAGSRP
jgi:uncharacterized protein (DUF58 family)